MMIIEENSMPEALVKELAIKLFKRFRFEAGWDDELRIAPAVSAWNIPAKQRIDSVQNDTWDIYCPYLCNGGYKPLINLVENRIASNLEFFTAAAGEEAH